MICVLQRDGDPLGDKLRIRWWRQITVTKEIRWVEAGLMVAILTIALITFFSVSGELRLVHRENRILTMMQIKQSESLRQSILIMETLDNRLHEMELWRQSQEEAKP